jgi:superfamily II DNA or RNA helicase
LLGGITSVIERDEIGEHLSHPKIIQQNSGFAMDVPMKKGPFGRRATFDSAEYQTLISEHSARNQLLANIVKGRVQQGHSVICLGHRIEQLTDIKRKLNDTGRPVVVHGAMKKSIREACMEGMRSQRSKVLLATYNLAGEGLDIPALSCLVYASPNGNPTRTEQSCGRVARPMQGKNEPIVVDLIDGDRKSLQYKKQREEVYSSLGYEVEMEQV